MYVKPSPPKIKLACHEQAAGEGLCTETWMVPAKLLREAIKLRIHRTPRVFCHISPLAVKMSWVGHKSVNHPLICVQIFQAWTFSVLNLDSTILDQN